MNKQMLYTLGGALLASTALSGTANCMPRFVAGPKDEGKKRPWFSMQAKAGVGEIHIYDYIDSLGVNGRSFLKELKALGDVSQLNVHINSPGGDVFEGNTIYNLLKSHKAKVTIYVDGLAASIASVIAMAGDKVIMPANAMMMIHEPWSMAVGSAEDMRKTAETLDQIKKTLIAAYQAKSGLNEAEIRTIMADETWLTADEAVSMKFADEVAEERKIAASLDPETLKKFKNCPPDFLASIAVAGPAKTGSTRSPNGDHPKEESTMDRIALLAVAAALGLKITASIEAVIEKLINDKTDAAGAVAELLKHKPAAEAAMTTDQINAAIATATREAASAERRRQSDIRAAATKLKMDGIAEFDALVLKLIDDGDTIEAARTKLFDARVAKEEKDGPIVHFSGNTRTYDNPEFRRGAVALAFAAQHSQRVKLTDEARPFATFRPMDMIAEVLAMQGVRFNRGDREGMIKAALHTTSDFPLLMADAANKLLLPEYEAANPTYKVFCAPKTFADFKPHKFLRLGDFPNLLEVGESGEVTRGTISENKEPVTMKTYARMLGVTRQMLINDDLSAFADLAMKAGRRVAMFENATVFEILLLNGVGPALSDGVVLFHTSHANFQTTGTAVNKISSLSEGRAGIQKQTGLDGMKLNLLPTILLTGPDSSTGAQQITAKTAPQRPTAFNPFSGELTPYSDAHITDYAWFLFADPAIAPVMVAGSLPGQSGPLVATQEGWNTLGMEIRVARDFAAGVVDYRGVWRNDGAAPVDEPTA